MMAGGTLSVWVHVMVGLSILGFGKPEGSWVEQVGVFLIRLSLGMVGFWCEVE